LTVIKASLFHPMRGHVDAGNQVLFSDGRVLTIKSAGNGGWALFDKDGKQVGDSADGAHALTTLIVSLEPA